MRTSDAYDSDDASLIGGCPDEDYQPLTCPGDPDGTDRITLVGLILETAAGLRRVLAPGLGCELGVGGQSFEILLRLSRSPGASLRMSDLAGQTGLTPSGLTRAIDRLCEAGLVLRATCPEDRRGAFAILTELGRARMDEALARHGLDIDAVIGDTLSAEDERQLRDLLRALRDRVRPESILGTTSDDSPHIGARR